MASDDGDDGGAARSAPSGARTATATRASGPTLKRRRVPGAWTEPEVRAASVARRTAAADRGRNDDDDDDDDDDDASEEAEEDVVMQSCVVSLRCALSLRRLKDPVRGRLCSAHQPFDREAFMVWSGASRTMRCPVCGKAVGPASLVSLPRWSLLLSKVADDVLTVRVDAPPQPRAARRARGGTERRRSSAVVHEVVDLVNEPVRAQNAAGAEHAAPPPPLPSEVAREARLAAREAELAAARRLRLAELSDVLSLHLEEFAASGHASVTLEMGGPEDAERRAVVHQICDHLNLYAEDAPHAVTVYREDASVPATG